MNVVTPGGTIDESVQIGWIDEEASIRWDVETLLGSVHRSAIPSRMGVLSVTVGSAIESYDIAPGKAVWLTGEVSGSWLPLPTELSTIMDPSVCPDVCPFASVLLAVALMAMGT